MSIFSGIVIYILTWWMAFFCVLPLNIQTIIKPTDGAMPGAPVDHGLKYKTIAATIIAGVLWVVIYLIITSNLISFRAIAEGMRR